MLVSLFTEQLREAKCLVQGHRAGSCNSLELPGAGVIRLNTPAQGCEKWVRDVRAWQSSGTGQLSRYLLLLLLFICSVLSDSLRPHGLQHPRSPCPLLSPRVCSGTCPLSKFCYIYSTYYYFSPGQLWVGELLLKSFLISFISRLTRGATHTLVRVSSLLEGWLALLVCSWHGCPAMLTLGPLAFWQGSARCLGCCRLTSGLYPRGGHF